MTDNSIRFTGATPTVSLEGSPQTAIAYDDAGIRTTLLRLGQPCYVVRAGGRIGVTNSERAIDPTMEVLAYASPTPPESLGDATFRQTHDVRLAYATGAMANGIASEDLVIAIGRAGMLGSFGAAGVVPARLEAAIERVQTALPDGPYAFNLIHSPSEERLESRAVDLYLACGVATIEASAFLDLTPHVVRYRAAGLHLNGHGEIVINNRVIAKVSRREVATKFMQPAPELHLRPLVESGQITAQQAELAAHVPMADDVTVEADSGGHTDNRPLVALLPSILGLRDEIQAKYNYPTPVRVGAAGGIGDPSAALAAFMMGAAYVVTGSINQACIEAGTSPYTKKILAQADMADVMMAPAADMFEMGVKVQLLKRGTLFPMRAQKLYELYRAYDSLEQIPADERDKLEKQVFKRKLDDIWADTVAYFSERDPDQIERAQGNPKRKMALVFRWYLGLSSRWSITGESGREVDYQIWCGPAIGAFNAWTHGTYLAAPENRRAVDVAHHIMRGSAYLYRIQNLRTQGVEFSAHLQRYVPSADA